MSLEEEEEAGWPVQATILLRSGITQSCSEVGEMIVICAPEPVFSPDEDDDDDAVVLNVGVELEVSKRVVACEETIFVETNGKTLEMRERLSDEERQEEGGNPILLLFLINSSLAFEDLDWVFD